MEEVDDTLSRKLQVLKFRGGSASTDWASIMDWRFFLAGGACAAFSHGITTPIGQYLNVIALISVHNGFNCIIGFSNMITNRRD